MKKILAVAYSYYTLLILFQLREKKYKEDEFDIIITDTTSNSELIYKRVEESGVFNRCYFLKQSEAYVAKEDSKIKKVAVLFEALLINKRIVRCLPFLAESKYDKFLTYVTDRVIDQFIFQAVQAGNPDVTCEIYEEAYASYYDLHGIFVTSSKYESSNLIPILYKFCGKKRLISQNLSAVWCVNPNLLLYSYEGNVKCIPPLSRMEADTIEKLNYIFDFNSEIDSIPQKYILLEDSPTMYANNSDDIYFFSKIANIVGQSNCVVKLHPASRVNRWAERGFATIEKNLPLEIYLLNENAGNKIFITMASGAPISCLLNFSDRLIKTYMLYKLSEYDYPQLKNEFYCKFIEKLEREYGLSNFTILESENDIDGEFR